VPDCTYSVPDLNVSGDALYGPRICNQPFIDFAWEVHGFNGDYWQDGWGYDDVCNIRKPLARCLNAMWLLTYSAEDYMNDGWDSGDILHFGPRYVREQFKSYNDLRANCGDGSASAVTSGCQWTRQWRSWRCTEGYNETKRDCRSWFFLFAWICHLYAEVTLWVCTAFGWVTESFCTLYYGTVGGGQNVTLTIQFFYPAGGGNPDVISRAGTLIHEARHIGNKPHDAQFPAGSVYGAGGDGADSTWQYEGACGPQMIPFVPKRPQMPQTVPKCPQVTRSGSKRPVSITWVTKISHFCLRRGSVPERAAGRQVRSPLFDIAFVLVRLNQVPSIIVNANHRIM
jgi:hypothetical protein